MLQCAVSALAGQQAVAPASMNRHCQVAPASAATHVHVAPLIDVYVVSLLPMGTSASPASGTAGQAG
jgi:hypothetical protein